MNQSVQQARPRPSSVTETIHKALFSDFQDAPTPLTEIQAAR